MKARRTLWKTAATAAATVSALGLVMPPAGAQEARPPLIQTRFADDNTQGWQAFGGDAKVAVVPDGEKKALRYDYKVEKGVFSAAFLPINQNEITTAKSLRFSVKADETAAVAVVLQEQEGGRYMALLHAPGGKWQEVALGVSDFMLTQGKDDPKDPNGRLDLDRVQGVAVADIGQIFAQTDDAFVSALFNVKKGPRHLLLNDFRIGVDPLATASFYSKADARLDTFGHPQVGWLAIGGANLTHVSGKPLGVRGLQATYRHESGKVAGVVRPVPQGRLAGAETLTFKAASARPMRLMVQVEERGGGKYDVLMDVPGEAAAKEFTIPVADLKPSDDSKDANNKLDLGQVHQILFLDLTGFYGKPDGDNTLWLGGLRAPVKAP